jgi:hypothetical protein
MITDDAFFLMVGVLLLAAGFIMGIIIGRGDPN